MHWSLELCREVLWFVVVMVVAVGGDKDERHYFLNPDNEHCDGYRMGYLKCTNV